jgi:PAS domain S-box-containing protein
MLAAIDREYRFLFANAAYREFNGLAENSVEGKPLEEVIGAEQQDEKVDWIERAFHGERVSYTQKRVGPNDNTHPLDIRYYPLRDREGEIVGVVTAQRDISDLRERERQLHVLDRVLRHNMHNSMTVIRGNAERIREKGTNDVRNLSKTIVTEANRLLDTVDKQRNITSLLSERTPLQRIDLATLVRTLAVRHEADTKKAEFQVTGPEDLSGRAVPQIETALDELLENAIIHSESEKPQVEIRMERDDDAVEIHVIDENPAIPEEEKKVLVGTRNIEPLFHGSGMGLWTVNWIVSRSEGELRFEADVSRGNRIVIRLPAA